MNDWSTSEWTARHSRRDSLPKQLTYLGPKHSTLPSLVALKIQSATQLNQHVRIFYRLFARLWPCVKVPNFGPSGCYDFFPEISDAFSLFVPGKPSRCRSWKKTVTRRMSSSTWRSVNLISSEVNFHSAFLNPDARERCVSFFI